MSTTTTQIPAGQVTESNAAQFAVELFTASTANLSTIDKKGNRVSFERSIVFASKEARGEIAVAVYEKQANNGIYGPLLSDSLSSGLLTKSQREIADPLMGAARNISKVGAIGLCQIILSLHVGKTLKGQKAFYYSLVAALAESLAA